MKTPKKQSETAESITEQTFTLLVAEDDSGLNRLIQKSLKREGFMTEGVTTGSDVIARVMENQNIVLLLDYLLLLAKR